LETVVWEVAREDGEPVQLHLGECIVLLNRLGITLREAQYERDPLEVEALLMAQLAQAEAARDEAPEVEPLNPEGEPAPAWVEELEEE
jgi:hypothetical protein